MLRLIALLAARSERASAWIYALHCRIRRLQLQDVCEFDNRDQVTGFRDAESTSRRA